jgi:galactokinase
MTKSPGRVNIIGEHTDHQNGFVLPMCIDLALTVWAFQRKDKKIHVYSEMMDEFDTFDTKKIKKLNGWKNYVRGVVDKFQEIHGECIGANIWISSSLPKESGLSSSAALELAIFETFEQLSNVKITDIEVIKACWQVENEFVGVSCGVMDQFVVKVGKKNHAVQINCADLSYNQITLPEQITFIIVDTKKPRNLTQTPYNQRIKECSSALKQLREAGLNISNLSDLNLENFNEYEKLLTDPYIRRVHHVISENERVKAFQQLITDSTVNAGQLLYESHASLKENFEATWQRADKLVEYCKIVEGVYGARMTGAGWGGSVLVMIKSNLESNIRKKIINWFKDEFNEYPNIITAQTHDGVTSEYIPFSKVNKNIIEFITQDLPQD